MAFFLKQNHNEKNSSKGGEPHPTRVSAAVPACLGDGITEATAMVRGYFGPAVQLIYAIGAIVGLIGATKVYSKFTSGDPDTAKTAAAWFGACIFLVVCATVLRSFFVNAPSVGL